MKNRSIIMVSLLIIGLGLFAGCFRYKQLVPPSSLATADPGPMEVLMKDGTIYRLDYAYVDLKEITGYGDLYPVKGNREYFSGRIPISDVTIVQTSKPDKFSSFIAAGTIGILVGATVGALGGPENPDIHAQIYYPPPPPPYSCPFVFSFDGTDYHFESETFAGALCKGLERTNLEPLKYLNEIDGAYYLAFANQLSESEHVNELSLLAVDHPAGTRVIPDARGQIHTVDNPRAPLSAVAFNGDDVLGLVAKVDDQIWSSETENLDFTSEEQFRDGIIIEFEKPAGATAAKLLISSRNTDLGYYATGKLLSLEGPNRLRWYHQLNSDEFERKVFLDWVMREGGLEVSLWVNGAWAKQGWLPDVGPRVTAEKIVMIDASQISSDRVKIKVESATDLWRIDGLAIDYSADEKVMVAPARLRQAVTGTGQDVALLISSSDSLYFLMLPGDHARLTYDAVSVSRGSERTYLLKSRGFYYAWVVPGQEDNSELVERILREPLFGSQLYMSEWKKVKHLYAKHDGDTPRFPEEDGHRQ